MTAVLDSLKIPTDSLGTISKSLSTNNIDSLQITLENLRFISGSYLNLISVHATNEWTVYISLITFFIVLSGILLKVNHKFLSPMILAIFCGALALIGSIFCVDIHCGHKIDTGIYQEANNQILANLEKHNLIDTLVNKNLTKKSFRDIPYFGGWAICGIQIIVILIFAVIPTIISISIGCSKKNNTP